MTTSPAIAVVKRVLPATPAEVFAEWTDADALRDWMCPRPAVPTEVAIDLRPGGRIRIDIDEDGRRFFVVGEYVAIDPPHRLAFTWWCSTWAVDTPTTLVTVSLAPRPSGSTLMTIRHERLPQHLLTQHHDGWCSIAAQLEDRLSVRRGLA